jgi:ATP-dependent Zn protease
MAEKPTKAQLAASAYHEAGHAFMAWRLRLAIMRITVVPKGDTSGLTVHSNPLRGISLEWDDSDRARMRTERAIKVCLAGPAAQRMYNPRSWRRYHGESDHDRAVDLALRMWGSGEQALLYLRLLGNSVRTDLSLWWRSVDALAATLIEKRVLNGSQIKEILRVVRPLTPRPVR